MSGSEDDLKSSLLQEVMSGTMFCDFSSKNDDYSLYEDKKI